MGEHAVEVSVKMQRGTGTDDRDTFTATVGGADVEAVDRKMQRLRDHAERWAYEFREIQPAEDRPLAEDQRTLEGEEVEA